MVYNRTDCALPHGYAEVGYIEYPGIGITKIAINFLKRLGRKVLWPIMYRTLIICRGYAFSYINTMYEQGSLHEYGTHVQAQIIDFQQSKVISSEKIISIDPLNLQSVMSLEHILCEEEYECIENSFGVCR